MAALLLAQTDTTGRTITLIVFGLVSVAAALALLTAWYWRVTDPTKRRKRTPAGQVNHERQGDDGRGGRRRAEAPEPAPDDAPRQPRIAVNSTPAEAADYDPQASEPSSAEPSSDATRVMRRAEILDHTQSAAPQRRVIDLRTPAAAEPAPHEASELASESMMHTESVPAESVPADMIDLTDSHDEPPSQPPEGAPRVEVASGGAHDAGLSFDDWLALAEEDQ